MSIHMLRFKCPKDNPLRKPTPVYVGSARHGTGGSTRWSGLYVRLGSRCVIVACY